MIFTPNFTLNSVLDINKRFLNENKIFALVLDLDNTLSLHDSPVEEMGITEWLESMRHMNINLIIASNNTKKRIKPLAEKLNLDFISFSAKPLSFGINRAIKKIGLPKNQICVVGDQIFTDVLAASFSGVRSILVKPFHLETGGFMKFKRFIERTVFNRKF